MRSTNHNIPQFIKYSITLLLFMFVFIAAKADENTVVLDSANSAYEKGNFDKAIQLYESIVAKNLVSAQLYYNLGNAYYKTNSIGAAILNYERAKKLAPKDENIVVNLKMANQRTEDKIDAAPSLFLTDWKNGIVNLLNEKQWSLLCILCLIISLALIAIYIVSDNNVFKKTGFFGGILLSLCTILLFFIAQQKYNATKYSSDAIIISSSVTVTSSPNEKGTKLFILHEGAKINITNESDDWTEIQIANGNVGWLKTSALQKI
jgi:tetratricopeptide (TPR) repeat protein